MLKIYRYLLSLFIIGLVFWQAADILAASRKAMQLPAAGSLVKTEYFTIKIPAGWKLIRPVKSQPNGGISAAFAPADNSLAITINVIRAPENAKLIADHTAKNMQKTGFQASTPKEKNGLWTFDISGKANGKAWFGANGSICGIVLMFGENFHIAQELLANLQSKDRNIFPKSI